MNGINRVTLIGNLTADPVVRQAGENDFTTFGVAINRRWGDNEEVTFLDCSAWEKLGKQVAEWGAKGRLVYIEGAIQVRKWEDGDGNKRTAYSIRCFQVQFLDRKPDENEGRRAQAQDDDGWWS